jgi:hypothetical protein
MMPQRNRARRVGRPRGQCACRAHASGAPYDSLMVTLGEPVPAGDSEPSDSQAPTSGLAKIALVFTYVASAATPWNGWLIAGLRPGDAFLLLALLTFFASDIGHRWPALPGWVSQFGAIIVLVTVLHELLPTDPGYLAQRLVVDPSGIRIPEIETNLGVGLKFVVPIIGLPLMFGFAYLHDRRALFRSAYAFAVGSAISGLIAFLDGVGVTHLSLSITGIPAVSARAPGLAIHPNFLATTCVLGIPIMLWQVGSRRLRSRVFAMLILIALALGVYASGSRGGAAVMAGVVLLSFAVMPVYRRVLPTVALLTVGAAGLVFVLNPSVGQSLLRAVRLSGNSGSQSGSDYVRASVGHQGVLDFLHSPIDGVGMQVAAEAHNVYLQALASGGLLLLGGYLIFVGSGLVKGFRQRKFDQLAYPFFIAALGGALLSTVENALTDRLAYVPLALIAAMPVGRAADPTGANAELTDDRPAVPHGRRQP